MQDSNNSQDELNTQALMLAKVVRRILEKEGDIILSKDPELKLKPIVDFNKKMRVGTLEKFNIRTFISTVNFYESKEKMDAHVAHGIIIIYLAEDYIEELFKKLHYKSNLDADDEEASQEICGKFANVILENFKTSMSQSGYQDLTMSLFSTYVNRVDEGVEAYLANPVFYEISFYIRDKKRLVIDFNLGPVTKE